MIFLLASIIFTFNVTDVNLDRSKINQSLSTITSVPLKYQNKEGIWLSTSDSEILLDLVSSKLKLSLDIIDNQNIQINALKSAVDSYKLSSSQYLELSKLNMAMYNTATNNLSKITNTHSWYNSSEAMYIYGFVSGAVVIMGTTYLAVRLLDK